LNLGVPGTGVSYRTRLDAPDRPPRRRSTDAQPGSDFTPAPAPVPQPVAIPHTYGRTEYRSGAADALRTPDLRDFTELVSEMNARRRRLSRALDEIRAALRMAERRLSLANLPIVRWLLTERQPLIARAKEELEAHAKIISEQQESCFVDADFDIADDVTNLFDELSRRFDELSKSSSIWDISDSVHVDRARSRSAASASVSRHGVEFSTASIESIESEFEALHLHNANGGDLFIFPCFVAIRKPDGEFAFLDIRQVQVRIEPTRFIEEGAAPSDAEQVGHAWVRSNKDGSPDRRFADNYQIPVYRYGQLFLTSDTGLNEAYMFSNWKDCESFGEAFQRYQRALPPHSVSSGQSAEGSAPRLMESLPELNIPPLPRVPAAMDARGWTISAVVVLGSAAAIGGAWHYWLQDLYKSKQTSGTSATPATSSPAATTSVPATVLAMPVAAVAPTPKPGQPPETAKSVTSAVPNALTKDEVAQLQRRLKELGFDPGTPDGVAGTRTAAAIKAYEAS
jgi:hypothetical protein